jgi:hypothetical protein
MKKPIYSRVDADLYGKVQEYSQTSGQTLSSAVESLLAQGLSALDAKARGDTIQKELAIVKDEVQKLRQERGDLQGKLQVCQKNESLALAARQQAESLKTQFEQMLSLGVATCGRQGCGQTWRLYDVWHHQCPKCGNMYAKLLDHYTPSPTPGESLRDVLAVVGGATALVGLLTAISANDDRA